MRSIGTPSATTSRRRATRAFLTSATVAGVLVIAAGLWSTGPVSADLSSIAPAIGRVHIVSAPRLPGIGNRRLGASAPAGVDEYSP